METRYVEKIDQLRSQIDAIGLEVETSHTLADAIREGSKVTEQKIGGWGDGKITACALSSAAISAKARGFIK